MARIYLSCQNLFTLTKYSGFDPEVGAGRCRSRHLSGDTYRQFGVKHSILNIMKKIYYIGLISLLTLFGACSDFLDKVPYEDPSAEALTDEASAIALVNGAYQPLQRPKLYNMRMWTLDIIAGNSEVGAGGGTDGIETVTLANFVATADNAAALDIWRGPNPGILYCNTVLKTCRKWISMNR